MSNLDKSSRESIAWAEKRLGHATGIGRVDRGECPVLAKSPIACTFCVFGHMLDCHYPQTCEEANCGHYKEGHYKEGE